jgi:hypothetical protein
MVVVPMMFVALEGDVLLHLEVLLRLKVLLHLEVLHRSMALLVDVLEEVDFLHSLMDFLRLKG